MYSDTNERKSRVGGEVAVTTISTSLRTTERTGESVSNAAMGLLQRSTQSTLCCSRGAGRAPLSFEHWAPATEQQEPLGAAGRMMCTAR